MTILTEDTNSRKERNELSLSCMHMAKYQASLDFVLIQGIKNIGFQNVQLIGFHMF